MALGKTPDLDLGDSRAAYPVFFAAWLGRSGRGRPCLVVAVLFAASWPLVECGVRGGEGCRRAAARGPAVLPNKGGSPRVSLAPSEDRSEASSHRACWIVVFRKVLPAKFIVRSMPEDCWIGCFRSSAPMFYLAVWFQRERFEALLDVNIMELVFFPWCWRRRS